MASRLCLGGDDGDSFADQQVHQGGLPDIGVANDVDEAGAVGRRDLLDLSHRVIGLPLFI